MELDVVNEMIKTAPGYACILAIVFLGMRWHEKIARHWVESFKEVGEKCHDSHQRIADMFHEQSCKGQEVLTSNTAVMAQTTAQLQRCAEAHEDQNRILLRSRGPI